MRYISNMTSLPISGKYLREQIVVGQRERVTRLGKVALGIHVVGENPVIETYIRAKVAYGKRIGATVVIYRHAEERTTDDILDTLADSITYCDGVIMQLPVPAHVDKERVLESIPLSHDVDMLSSRAWQAFENAETRLVPPVGRAVEIALASLPIQSLMFREVHAAVVGFGRLVGQPAAVILDRMGCHVHVVEKETPADERAAVLGNADIVVSGVGIPNLIMPPMVKDGVVLLDGGTSESNGGTVGDISLECREKARYFAEVPGGLGPLTVVSLFENLLLLAESRKM